MPRRARTLSDVGESGLIERIARRAGHASSKDWPLGIGDDAAILRPRTGFDLLLSTDAHVEDVHFRFDREPPRVIGRRAIVVNLSDLAAMGAIPVGCLLSLAAPATLDLRVFDSMIAGFVDEAKRYGCPLVGGNLTRAESCSLHVTVVGRVATGTAMRRGRLRRGDELFVTGTLGGAALARMRADRFGTPLRRVPVPRLDVGRRLARSKAATACIDLSDGVATDLLHLLAGTRLGAEIDVDALPAPRGFERACERAHLDARRLMLEGGEDYELMFACRPGPGGSDRARLARASIVPMTRIGRIVGRPGVHGLPPESGSRHHF